MNRNESNSDRIVRGVAAAGLVVLAAWAGFSSVAGVILLVVAAVLGSADVASGTRQPMVILRAGGCGQAGVECCCGRSGWFRRRIRVAPVGDGYGGSMTNGDLVAASQAKPPSRVSGVLYGLGLGGFVDGIVLHQIFQWHHMISHVGGYPTTTIAGLEANTLADGFFHVATWFLVLGGSIAAIVAWRQGRLAPNWSFHFGLVLVGWGIFNLVEGVVDHHLLGVHHVRDDLGGPLSWDIAFLMLGAGLVAGGCLLHRRGAAALERQATRVTVGR